MTNLTSPLLLTFAATLSVFACTAEDTPESSVPECGDTCDDGYVGSTGSSIRGMIYESYNGSRPPLKYAEVAMHCDPDNSEDDRIWQDETDKYGQYTLARLPTIRWCYISVSGYSRNEPENLRVSNEIKINSATGSKRMNFLVEKNEDVPDGWILYTCANCQ